MATVSPTLPPVDVGGDPPPTGRPELEASLLHTLDTRCIPLITACYLLALLDRANLGAVKEPLSDDLGLSESEFSLASAIFFATYIPAMIPVNLLTRRHGSRPVLTILVILFGLISALTAGTSELGELVAVRLVLGVTEAGVFPAIVYFLSCWYRPEERGRRLGYFMWANVIAGVIGGLLAFGLLSSSIPGIASWRVLFLVEGLPAVALGVLVWRLLPGKLEEITWLTPEERELAASRVNIDAHQGQFDIKALPKVLRDPNTWLFCLQFFFTTNMTYQLSFYTPTLVQKQLGYSLAVANLVAVPISLVSGIALYLITQHSDKSRQRHLSSMACALAAAFGFTMVLVGDTFDQPWVAYVGLMIATSGAIANVPLTTVWLTDGLTDSGEIALYSAVMISVGNLGGISGPQIYGAVGSSRTKADGSPDYRIAHAVMACIGAGAFCTAAILTYTTTCTVTTATYDDGREDKNTPGHANTRASESTPLLQTDESLSSV
eukprot:m.56522 g.56522  ORF g.56522 m.56522 type:complete len:493 (+) comp16983_c0_seq1:386-1864(+)